MINNKKTKYILIGCIAIILIIATFLTCNKKPKTTHPDTSINEPAETDVPETPEPSAIPSDNPETDESDTIKLSDIKISDAAKETYTSKSDGSSDYIPEKIPDGGIDTSADGAYDKTVAVTDDSDNFTDVVWDVATEYGFTTGSCDMNFWHRYDLNNGGQEVELGEFPDGLFRVEGGTRTRHKIKFESGYELAEDAHCHIVGIVEIKDGTTTLHSLMVDGQPLLDDGLGKYMYS